MVVEKNALLDPSKWRECTLLTYWSLEIHKFKTHSTAVLVHFAVFGFGSASAISRHLSPYWGLYARRVLFDPARFLGLYY